jgi:hypothetical protein
MPALMKYRVAYYVHLTRRDDQMTTSHGVVHLQDAAMICGINGREFWMAA